MKNVTIFIFYFCCCKRTGQTLLVNVIRERRLRWLGHVTRMDEARIPKQALQWEVAGFKRRPGRPRINWRDTVNKDLQRMGLTWEEVEASCGPMHRGCWMNQGSRKIIVSLSNNCRATLQCHTEFTCLSSVAYGSQLLVSASVL